METARHSFQVPGRSRGIPRFGGSCFSRSALKERRSQKREGPSLVPPPQPGPCLGAWVGRRDEVQRAGGSCLKKRIIVMIIMS